MNWAYFGVAGMLCLCLFIAVFVLARRGWNATALVVALANWLVAAIHFAAPFRGLFDPAYVGYGFGLVCAQRGVSVTVLAGFFLVGGAVSAALAANQAKGWPMSIVAIFDSIVLIVFRLPLIDTALTNPSQYRMQFGEYLTVPATIALPLMLVFVLVPLVLGTAWSVRRVTRR